MATVTYIRETKQSVSAMRGLIGYCCREDKITDELGRRYCSGVNCCGENAFAEFMLTKAAYRKNNGMNFYQYVQSFSPEENISYEEAHAIALEFAARAWPGHEVLVTTHCDAPHIHSHFVINSVSFETGYKLRQRPGTLKELREISDEICAAHSLTVLEPYKKDGAKLSAREYRVASKGESWKFQLMAQIEDAMEKTGSREKFLSEMRRHGYEVTWTTERKYITYRCPNGMKCRDIRLHDEKFTKENMELEFTIRKQIAKNAAKEFSHSNAHAEKRRVDPEDRADALRGAGLRHPRGTAQRGTESTGSGGGISAGAVQDDSAAIYQGRAGGLRFGDSEYRSGLYGEHSSEATESQRGDDGLHPPNHLTGWESARGLYLQMLFGTGTEQAADRKYNHRSAPKDTVADDLYLGSGYSAVGLGLRGLLEAGSIIQDNREDPEERRKRITARENGADLGAVIGLAAGLILNATENSSFNDDALAEEENNGPTLGGVL